MTLVQESPGRSSVLSKVGIKSGITRVVPLAFAGLLLLNGLASYSIGPLPLPWLANFGTLALVVALAFISRLPLYPGTIPLFLFLLWVWIATAVGVCMRDYASFLPPFATSDYPFFLALRLLNLAAFAAVIMVVWWLCAHGYRDRVSRILVQLSAGLALLAIYIYLAQLYDLPEPHRTRVTTSGAETYPTVYTYAFHRAVGTFREPSHLAEWLVAPLLLSFALRGLMATLAKLVMLTALLLTGSLTGIVGLVAGFAIALSVGLRAGCVRLTSVIAFGGLGTVSLVVFGLIVHGYGGVEINLWQVLSGRLQPILEQGMAASNRGYISNFMAEYELTLLGVGLGNANLVLSQHFGSEAVMSFLSLYFQYAVSVGIIGLVLLAILFMLPFAEVLRRQGGSIGSYMPWLLGAYIAWLIMFAGHSEEPTMLFGIIFALLTASAGGAEGERDAHAV